MKALQIAIIFVVLSLFAMGTPAQLAQTQQFPNVSRAVEAIGANYSIQIGLEVSDSNAQVNAPIHLDMGADAAAAFTSLVSQKTAYRWTIDNSIYWVRPKVDALSEISIGKFTINDATRAEASQAISTLPEVQNWLVSHRETRRELINQSTYRDHTRKSLSVSGVSIGALLNQLIITFGDQQWSISHVIGPDDTNKYVSIYF
jgi:hypothetical protein